MTTAFDYAWFSLKKAWYDEVDDPYRNPKELRESDFPPGTTRAERMAAARKRSEEDPGQTAKPYSTEDFDEVDAEAQKKKEKYSQLARLMMERDRNA
tara:strand:- start:228 stop:518 length:291 start_codon:yes stop_codon:yes gene_type:complete